MLKEMKKMDEKITKETGDIRAAIKDIEAQISTLKEDQFSVENSGYKVYIVAH